MKEFIEQNPDSYAARQHRAKAEKAKIRHCGYCNERGHNRRSCSTLKHHIAHVTEAQEAWSSRMRKWMIDNGAGVGSLVLYHDGDTNRERIGVIKRLDETRAIYLAQIDAWAGDFIHVEPLGPKERWGSRFLRPPVDCPGFFDHAGWGGGARVKEVSAPISSSLVEGQLEKLTPPAKQINGIFKDEGATFQALKAAKEVLGRDVAVG